MKVEKLAKNGEMVQNCYPLSPAAPRRLARDSSSKATRRGGGGGGGEDGGCEGGGGDNAGGGGDTRASAADVASAATRASAAKLSTSIESIPGIPRSSSIGSVSVVVAVTPSPARFSSAAPSVVSSTVTGLRSTVTSYDIAATSRRRRLLADSTTSHAPRLASSRIFENASSHAASPSIHSVFEAQ